MRRLPWLLFIIACTGGAPSACTGPDNAALCDEAETCIGGNDADVDACIARMEYYGEQASIQGCTDEYDKLFDCFLDNSECTNDKNGATCTSDNDCRQSSPNYPKCSNGACSRKKFSFSDPKSCEPEQNAFQQCAAFSSFQPNGGAS